MGERSRNIEPTSSHNNRVIYNIVYDENNNIIPISRWQSEGRGKKLGQLSVGVIVLSLEYTA